MERCGQCKAWDTESLVHESFESTLWGRSLETHMESIRGIFSA